MDAEAGGDFEEWNEDYDHIPLAPTTCAALGLRCGFTISGWDGVATKTLKRYASDLDSLVRRWTDTEGTVRPRHPINAFATWMIDTVLDKVSPQTWRFYRTVLRNLLRQVPYEMRSCAENSLERLTSIPASVAGSKRLRRREKAKNFPQDDFIAVINRLNQMAADGRESADLAMVWLLTCRLTGARPNELWLSHFHDATPDDPPRLVIKNAKRSDYRGCGDERTLYLNTFSDDHLSPIRELLKTFSDIGADKSDHDRTYNAVRKTICDACQELWPQRLTIYSIYSARHALIADLKLSYTKEEVAAIVGHAVTATAGEHYGRHRGKNRPVGAYPLPAPSPENIAKVRTSRPNRFAAILEYDTGAEREPRGGL